MDAGWDYERFKAFTCADDDDIDTFRRLAGPTIGLKRGDTLRMQGSPDPQVYMLLSGWVACSIIVGESARQIVKVHLPGDLVGMPSLAAPTACDTIEAVSAAKLGVIETAAIGQVFDGALLIVIFVTSGALEAFATRRTADAVRGLTDLAPEQATLLSEVAGVDIGLVNALASIDTEYAGYLLAGFFALIGVSAFLLWRRSET